MPDGLLIVAIKTDQPNIKRRMETILAAAAPVQDPPNTEAQVYAKPVEELRAADLACLAHFVGGDGIDRLNIREATP